MSRLRAEDRQFAQAAPDDSILEALEDPGLRLCDILRIVMEGYSDRPALGQRATALATDPVSGRTAAQPLPRFDTVTYADVWKRVRAVASGLADLNVQSGDRIATLGFTSVDYTVIDLALMHLGAVAVPLPGGVPLSILEPIVTEIRPTVLAASIRNLTEAVDVVLSQTESVRLVAFDYRAEVDDHRDALDAANRRLTSGASLPVITLLELEDQANNLAPAPEPATEEDDRTALLLYTSGSTGTPKGAVYPKRLLANWWRPRSANPSRRGAQVSLPSITLNFMPMSHGYGRATIYGTLANGGTAYFVGDSNLSTMLEDLALVRPTMLNFVPRIWDMLHDEFTREVDRRTSGDADRARVEAAVKEEQRDRLLGGRFYAALTGSAPTSAEMKAWAESYLDMPIVEGYGSTEQGVVLADGHIRRPPVIDYKLIDVPDLGYFGTDRPHPRGELLIKSEDVFGGYFMRPGLTAEVFDEDGFYRTGDIMAQLGPDHLRYVDRRNNVLKLSQGEFVAVSTLETVFTRSPLVHQVYLYGNSARPYLLAVVVPNEEALSQYSIDVLKAMIGDSLHAVGRAAQLQSYEIPRDFIIEGQPFTSENGLLTGIGKLARPNLKARYGARLEQIYTDLDERQSSELHALKQNAADTPVLETITRAANALVGATTDEAKADAGLDPVWWTQGQAACAV
ncbi:MAG: AMP-binding protein [Mycobacterium sp.]